MNSVSTARCYVPRTGFILHRIGLIFYTDEWSTRRRCTFYSQLHSVALLKQVNNFFWHFWKSIHGYLGSRSGLRHSVMILSSILGHAILHYDKFPNEYPTCSLLFRCNDLVNPLQVLSWDIRKELTTNTTTSMQTV